MAGVKILIVDDEPKVLKAIETMLTGNGFQVITAGSGEEGIKKAKEEKPGLIMLDIVMRGINGKETLKRLRADETTKHIPAIMLTVSRDAEDIVESMVGAGAIDYITKPFEENELLERIKKVLAK